MVCNAPYLVLGTFRGGIHDLAVGLGVPVAQLQEAGLPTLFLLYATSLAVLLVLAFALDVVARVYSPIHRGVLSAGVRVLRYVMTSVGSIVPASVAKMLTPR